MDALVQEVNGVATANHSCGHDPHSTIVLFLALAIASSGIRPKLTLRLIFQPAEEKGEGDLQMINDGAFENVTYLHALIYGMKILINTVILAAEEEKFTIKI
ncbi:M20/M25/M40 family metallo-hydrolase [Peribacillus simplex]|uniref:M20/M25/M40 family metallo-hydrolase n=1 Tax=Peribacillus simplex TaxID=1478 RepID=A0AAW7IF14_9BACI|nr:M20/M25/M40 family metallo-hydrolase [Peribacillus simplex]MDM5454115.1 M20/M25/M40 family metallo-hydrolase [Peribacillus simplex]